MAIRLCVDRLDTDASLTSTLLLTSSSAGVVWQGKKRVGLGCGWEAYSPTPERPEVFIGRVAMGLSLPEHCQPANSSLVLSVKCLSETSPTTP